MRGSLAWAWASSRASLLAFALAAASAGILLLDGAGENSAFAQGRAGTETEEDALFKKAEEHFNNGDYASAADLYDQVIKLNPTRVEAFVKRATLYFSERNFTQAIELLTRAEKLSYTDLNIKTVLGLCFYESGQKERGLTYLEDVVKQRPESYQAQFQIGKHYVRIDPVRAITALESFFRYRPEDQRPKDFAAQLLLGTAYYLRGNLPEAEKLLNQAREARPKDNQVRQMLGTVYLSEGRWPQAAELYEAFANDVDRRPSVAFNLATCYLRMGRREDAKKFAQKYYTLRRDDARGLLLLAAIDRAGDKESDARAALQKYQAAQEALRSQPETATHVNIPAAIARTYLQLKDVQHAISTVEPVLNEARAKGSEAELIAVMIESRLAQMTQAHMVPGSPSAPPGLLTLADRLAELASSDAGALALAGSASYAAGNFEKARRFYTDARTIDEKQPRARVGLARTLEQLALAELAKSDEKEPQHEKDKTQKHAVNSEARTAALVSAASSLREAQKLDESPNLARNLAAVYLMQGQAADAERVLTPLLSGGGRGDAVAWRLHSRAQQLLGKVPTAQEGAERAVAEAKRVLDSTPASDAPRRALAVQRLAEAQVDLAARFLSTDKDTRERLEKAVDSLEQAVKELSSVGDSKEFVRVAQRDLAIAYLRRGRMRLTETENQVSKNGVSATTLKMAEEALNDLQDALETGALEAQGASHETGQALCLASLAATQANQFKSAREFVNKANSAGCELVKPYNRLGTELLSAFVAYRSSTAPAQREQLLRTLPRLQSRASSGPESATLLKVLRSLIYSTNMALAYDYHLAGHTKLVGQSLHAAQKSLPRAEDEDPILQHNLAVLDLNEGRGIGEKTLERLAPHPAESLVNLGILQDRRGQPRKALELYRRALERGARTPKLREWIDTKDRLLGQGAGQGSGPQNQNPGQAQ